MKMKAIQYWGIEDIRYEDVEIKEPKAGEVLVKVEAALTCGTDLKTLRRGHPVLIKSIPSGFGHEFAGIIEKVGANVTEFKVGDRVVAANSAPCGKCFYCQKEQFNLCENLEFLNGAYAQYITVPKQIVEKNMVKLPDDLPFELAAFAEPLANVVHGVERTDIKAKDVVGIIGTGPIGLMFARLAKLKGAKVIIAGRNEKKLNFAKEFAQADETINIKKYQNPEKIFKSFTTSNVGLDVAVECTGIPEIWELLLRCVRKGGTVHFFGGCKSGSKIELDTTQMHYGDIRILSVFHHTPKYFRMALDLIAKKKIDVSKLIGTTLPLEKTKEALQLHENGNAIKVLIKPN